MGVSFRSLAAPIATAAFGVLGGALTAYVSLQLLDQRVSLMAERVSVLEHRVETSQGKLFDRLQDLALDLAVIKGHLGIRAPGAANKDHEPGPGVGG